MRYAGNFLQILRQYGPYDVVHSHVHQFSGFVMLLSALAQIPARIAHGHTARAIHQPSTTLKRKLYDRLARDLVAHFSTKGVAVSRDAADGLFPVDWQSHPKWSIAYTGIDLSPFEEPVDRAAVRSELGIPSDAVVIGHVGRFVPEKNHSFLIRVAREFSRLEPRAFFLLVGDGELRSEIESQVRTLGLERNFRFAGMRRDVPRLMMGAMDVLVLPSLYEGIPLTLLEAQAAGLRCVVSDVITKECDIVPSVINRQRLSGSPATWAKSLQVALGESNIRSEAANLVDRSVQTSIDELVMHYIP